MIGSHNTMSYKKPKQWYTLPFCWMAKCQTVDYKTQHEKYGINCFDIRIFWDSKGNIEYRHGLVSYDASDLDEVLQYASDNNILIRMMFEERNWGILKKRSEKMNLKQKFIDFCDKVRKDYPLLKMYGGRNVGTWDVVYDFANPVVEVGYYSSVTSMFKSDNEFLRVCDDWWPLLYAKYFNHKNMELNKAMHDTNIVVQYDFVEIQ